jgi:hypothetical protein
LNFILNVSINHDEGSYKIGKKNEQLALDKTALFTKEILYKSKHLYFPMLKKQFTYSTYGSISPAFLQYLVYF